MEEDRYKASHGIPTTTQEHGILEFDLHPAIRDARPATGRAAQPLGVVRSRLPFRDGR
jgi:hypothetical protein